jgi:hypothetical protein
MLNKLKVYLDTSVIGGCFDEEFREASLAMMQHVRLGHLHRPLSMSHSSEGYGIASYHNRRIGVRTNPINHNAPRTRRKHGSGIRHCIC